MAGTVYNLTHMEVSITIAKVLDFDVTIRVHKRVLTINDVVIEVLLPTFVDYDVLTIPFRKVEHIKDSFKSSKEDTPSFYEVLERKNEYIHANYIAPNLKSIEPLSERWNRPLGKFDAIHALSASQDMQHNMGYYVTLIPKEFRYLKSVYEYDEGFAVSSFRTAYSKKSSGLYTDEEELYKNILYDSPILYKAVISDHLFPLLSNVETNERILSIYYGVFYVPYQRDYVFRVTKGSGDEVVEIFVDETKVLGIYNYSQGETISYEIPFSMGYHKIKIIKLHRVGGTERRIYIKRVTTQEEVLLNVDGMNSLVLGLWHPVDFKTEEDNKFYISNPLAEINYYGLIMTSYLPYVILAMPDVEKVRNNFIMNYWFKPEQITFSNVNIISGSISNLYSPYTIDNSDYGNVGIKADKKDLNKPILLTLTWETPIPVNALILCEGEQGSYGLSNKVRIKFYDNVGSFIKPSKINIQQDKSVGIKHVEAEESWITLYKEEKTLLFLYLEEIINILKIEMEIYPKEGWCFTSVITGLVKYNNFYALDSKRRSYELEQLDYSKVSYYDDISNIPQVYRHHYLPSDIKYGSEFIIFALSKGIQDIEINPIGTEFIVHNSFDITDEEPKIFVVHNLYGNKYKYNIYESWDKEKSVNWNYVYFDAGTNELMTGTPDTINVIVRNLTDVSYSPAVITLNVPNYGYSWSCIVNGQNVPCMGKNKEGNYVSTSEEWNTNTIVIQLTELQANQTLFFTIQNGDFLPSISTEELDPLLYDVAYDVYDTSVVIAETGKIKPKETKSFYIMNDDTPNPTFMPSTMPSYISYYEIFIINKASREGEQEVILDLSFFQTIYGYHIPFKLVDAKTKQEIPFCYRNSIGEYTDIFAHWNKKEVLAKVNVRAEGTKLLLTTGAASSSPITDFNFPAFDALNKDSYLILQFNNIIVDRSSYQHKIEYGNVEFVPDKEGNPFSSGYYGTTNSYTHVYVNTFDSSFSLTFWFKTSDKDLEILYTGDMDNKGLSIKVVEKMLVVYVEEVNTIDTQTDVADNQWHFISIVVRSDKTVSVSIDKNNVGNTTSTSVGRNTLHIGSGRGSFTIDELRLISREINQQEESLMYENYRLVTINNKLDIIYKKSPMILYPASVVTNLVNLESIQATPVIIHKYPDIDSVIIEGVE